MNEFSIGKTAEITGLPAKTIRFYEESGLVSAQRLENGYRFFDVSTINELKLIKSARDLGLPLTVIKKLIKGCNPDKCCHSRNEIETTIDDLSARLDENLERMLKLQKLLAKYRAKINGGCSDGYCCNVLYQLLDIDAEGGDDHG